MKKTRKNRLTRFTLLSFLECQWGFPGGSDGKESACNAGDLGSTLGQEDPLEKGRATHSSILSRRIPRTEESGGLQSMGSQRDTTEATWCAPITVCIVHPLCTPVCPSLQKMALEQQKRHDNPPWLCKRPRSACGRPRDSLLLPQYCGTGT